MAKGINAIYSEKPQAELNEDDEDESSMEDESRLSNDALLNHLRNMGLLFTKETSLSLVLIISNTPHSTFDIKIQDEGHVDIVFHSERPTLALFRDLRVFIGLLPEEWGLES